MSIYIIFIAVFFLNGYIFEPASSGNLNISQDKDKSLAIKDSLHPLEAFISDQIAQDNEQREEIFKNDNVTRGVIKICFHYDENFYYYTYIYL